jgi:tRNA (mo5U34)-methyltransferase
LEREGIHIERSEIQEQIDGLDETVGWYHDIDLGDGLHTKTRVFWGEDPDHPRRRWTNVEPAVPADLRGMSVLDIGCNAGFFALEAKKRGADYVCGVDISKGYIQQARFCADVLDLDVDFQTCDVYELDTLGRRFDLVFCVGVLYHCKHLLPAVAQIAGRAQGTLIVESAIDLLDSDIPYVRFVRSGDYGGPDAEGDRRLTGTWHPTMPAMEALFRAEGFPTVERLFVEGGRGGLVAYR